MSPIAKTRSNTPAETIERLGRFPKQFVYLAIGLTQGLLLALLVQDSAAKHPVLFFPLFITATLLPMAFYCSQAADWRRRFWILGVTAALTLIIGIYQGVTVGEISRSRLFEYCAPLSFTLALAIFVGVPALSVSAATWEERYRQWVAAALQTFGALAQAGLVLGLCWTVISSSVGLFDLIGVRWLDDFCFNRYFFVITSSVVVALVASRSRRDDSIMSVIFTRFMQLCGWIYPVVAVIGILFVTSWLAGIETLLETHKAATILLWFVALLIFFFNLHSRCGTEERSEKWLRVLTALSWPAALSMLLVALYGLGVRIHEHGLTPERVRGLFTAFIIAIFVSGYAAHSLFGLRQRQGGKRLIARTHLAATLALVTGVLLMQIGVADPRLMSVYSQSHRLEKELALNGKLTNNAENMIDFLAEKSGIYGKNALRELVARDEGSMNQSVAQYAKLALAGEENRYKRRMKFTINKLRALKVFPGAEAPPPGLVEAIAAYSDWIDKSCGNPQDDQPDTKPACIIWKVRLEKEGAESYILLTKDRPAAYGYAGEIWQKSDHDGSWMFIERLQASAECFATQDILFDAILANTIQLVPPKNPRYDILVGNTRIIPPSQSQMTRFGCFSR
jgi:hypothetical protein